LSDANKLLIRCAWTGGSAFADAGYDENSWASGKCPPPSNQEFGGSGGGGVGVAGPAAGGAAAFLLLVAGAGAVIWKRKRLGAVRRAGAPDPNAKAEEAAAGVAAQSEA
jgi:hypothetical protein